MSMEKKMKFLLLLDEMSFRHQLGLYRSNILFEAVFLLIFIGPDDLCALKNECEPGLEKNGKPFHILLGEPCNRKAKTETRKMNPVL